MVLPKNGFPLKDGGEKISLAPPFPSGMPHLLSRERFPPNQSAGQTRGRLCSCSCIKGSPLKWKGPSRRQLMPRISHPTPEYLCPFHSAWGFISSSGLQAVQAIHVQLPSSRACVHKRSPQWAAEDLEGQFMLLQRAEHMAPPGASHV